MGLDNHGFSSIQLIILDMRKKGMLCLLERL